MTDFRDRQDDIDRYLDGLLLVAERDEFERQLKDESALREQIELQRKVDSSLRRLFPGPADPPALTESAERTRSVVGKPLSTWKRWLVPALVTAACLAWVTVVWQLAGGPGTEITFLRRPLPEVFAEVVEQGFRPYWVCDDDHRFAATFETRLGRRLKLLPLPEGRQMIGLSYLPSISRDTTAMLGMADGHKILVFVDRLESDRPMEQPHESTGLRWFRRELDGLVLYELTPLDESRFLDYLMLVANRLD